MPNCLKVVLQDTNEVILSILIDESQFDCCVENRTQCFQHNHLFGIKLKLKGLPNHEFNRKIIELKHFVHIGENPVVLIIKSNTKYLVVLVVCNTTLQELDEALCGSDEVRSLDKAQEMRDFLEVLSIRECDTIDGCRRVDIHCFSS